MGIRSWRRLRRVGALRGLPAWVWAVACVAGSASVGVAQGQGGPIPGIDPCPGVPFGHLLDTDNDGIANENDPDSPWYNPRAWGSDFDGDGIPNQEDFDDDNDFIPDCAEYDDFSGDPAGRPPRETDFLDDDGDGCPNINDPDSQDFDPWHPNSDYDGDGIPNQLDPDDDNDMMDDNVDPDHPAYDALDLDGDGIPDAADTDDDGDGVPDDIDPQPLDCRNNGGGDSECWVTICETLPLILNELQSIDQRLGDYLPTIDQRLSAVNSNAASIALAAWQSLAAVERVEDLLLDSNAINAQTRDSLANLNDLLLPILDDVEAIRLALLGPEWGYDPPEFSSASRSRTSIAGSIGEVVDFQLPEVPYLNRGQSPPVWEFSVEFPEIIGAYTPNDLNFSVDFAWSEPFIVVWRAFCIVFVTIASTAMIWEELRKY
jgi:hypothetical protein